MNIYPAKETDLPAVNGLFEAVMDHEARTVKYSVFEKGVYPTADLLLEAIKEGFVYLLENHDGAPCGCVVGDRQEPEEYAGLDWTPGKALVVHLLAIHPAHAGKGYGSLLMEYVMAQARALGCVSVKVDTGEQNLPARRLYAGKLGFRTVACIPMHVGGRVWHKEHYFFEKLTEHKSGGTPL